MIELHKGKGPGRGPFRAASRSSSARCCTSSTRRRGAPRQDLARLRRLASRSPSVQAQQQAHRVAHALLERFGSRATSGCSCATRWSSSPPLRRARGPRRRRPAQRRRARPAPRSDVIERSDVRAIVARADLLDLLEELDALGAVELIVVTGDGERPERRPRRRGDRLGRLARRPPARRPASTLPDAMRDRPDPVHLAARRGSKGVVYPHHFLYLYSAAVADSQGHTADDVLSTPLPLFHVAAVHIISNSALHAGCTAHLKSRFSAQPRTGRRSPTTAPRSGSCSGRSPRS